MGYMTIRRANISDTWEVGRRGLSAFDIAMEIVTYVPGCNAMPRVKFPGVHKWVV